jgi:Leucine-rich repeat (LRR) protein
MNLFRRRLIPVWIGTILLSGMFLMGQGDECPWGSEVVDFPDPALEQAVRDTIRKPGGEICSSDLLRLWSLGASGLDISEISGLEYCTNLILLALSGNQISDLTPLSGLVNLYWLGLRENQISDLTPLSGLVNLY